MASNTSLFIGTIGQSVWRSEDSGDSWDRATGGDLYMEADIRSLAIHPTNRSVIYAGTGSGCYRSDDSGSQWSHLPSPMDSVPIWELVFHPQNPEIMFAGTRPANVYRTGDGGRSWDRLNTGMSADCPPIVHTRVTTIRFDPSNPDNIFAGVEIDGLYNSCDGGETWTVHKDGLNSEDVHALAISHGAPGRILASTNAGLCISEDDGENWSNLKINAVFPWGYCRGVLAWNQRLLVGNGSGPPGDGGSIQYSTDAGETWTQAILSHPPNSTIWDFTHSTAVPGLLFSYSVSGQVFRSRDMGQSWEKLPREFGEIRAISAL
jgi:photosystem II stability/assembly factor-like uncharacterized protein